ncbi:Ig-like domain-containing protein [Candidatus Arsenophonus triatominarum]|uniref:Ig-like domain-containing protein n=1 Tax=Candidatus Arsenophonus triatominarum TaxID=57911 RepID=UPI0007C4B850|nr:Ig-like domain-containing protein [Candidatus Arsenophonus triatominarum]
MKVANKIIRWHQDKNTDVNVPPTSETDANGQAKIRLTSTTKAVDNVMVSAQYEDTPQREANERVSFIADISTAKIGSIELNDTTTTKIADGSQYFTYTAQLVDKNGNLLKIADKVIDWHLNKNTNVNMPSTSETDANGQAKIRLTSTTKAVDSVVVSAQYENTPQREANKRVSFIADISTARIGSIKLDDATTTKIADGSQYFTYTAQLIDDNGNLIKISNKMISWYQDKDNAVILPKTSETDANGQAKIRLTSTTKAVDNVVVSAQYESTPQREANKRVSFIADSHTAHIDSLNVDKGTATANGSDVITFTVTVKDANGNLVPKNEIAISQSPEGTGTFENLNDGKIITDANGQATFRLRSNKAENVTVTAVNDTDTTGKEKVVNFEPNDSTATIAIENDKDSGIANGSDVITFTVTIKDGNRNPFINHQLNIKTTLGGLNPKTVKTDQHGKATFTLESKKSGNATTVTHSV